MGSQCGGCCVQHTASPRFLFVQCLSTESRLQPRVRQQAVTIISTGARRTGKIVCEAAGWRDTHTALKHGQTYKVRQEVVAVFRVLQLGACSIYHLFYIYRWESRKHKINRASSMEPPSVLVTPLSITLAQGGPMPQQSYPHYSNCRALARGGSLVNCSLPIILNLSYPANLILTTTPPLL